MPKALEISYVDSANHHGVHRIDAGRPPSRVVPLIPPFVVVRKEMDRDSPNFAPGSSLELLNIEQAMEIGGGTKLPAARSPDFREPRPRRQHERKISFHVGVEGEVETGERAQQVLLVARISIAVADEEFGRRHDVLAVDDA